MRTAEQPPRLASSRLKNPKLWQHRPSIQPPRTHHSQISSTSPNTSHTPRTSSHRFTFFQSSLQLPAHMPLGLGGLLLSLILFIFMITTTQPASIQNIPWPDWYAPLHLLLLGVLSSFFYVLSGSGKIAVPTAGFLVTLLFFKLQHIMLNPTVVLLTLILFGTIALSAHLFTIITSRTRQKTQTPTLHSVG